MGWALVVLQWNTSAPLLLAGVVVDIGAACLVLAVIGSRGSRIAFFLSLPSLVYAGKISYSLYLWHYLVVRALRETADPLTIALAVAAVGGAAAVLNYEFIEKPLKAWLHSRTQPA